MHGFIKNLSHSLKRSCWVIFKKNTHKASGTITQLLRVTIMKKKFRNKIRKAVQNCYEAGNKFSSMPFIFESMDGCLNGLAAGCKHYKHYLSGNLHNLLYHNHNPLDWHKHLHMHRQLHLNNHLAPLNIQL